MIRGKASQQVKLVLVLQEKITKPSIPKSHNSVEFGLGISDELLRTSLMIVLELMKPSWCRPSPNAGSRMYRDREREREGERNAECTERIECRLLFARYQHQLQLDDYSF